ncbi:MAG: energy transducer TonB [bacterium]|nr:energy transducer TonB [bacterium]
MKYSVFIVAFGISSISIAQEEKVVVEPNMPAPVRPKESPKKYIELDGEKYELSQFPDEEAVFPGGADSLNSYLKQNLKYPAEALENGMEGKAFVVCLVDTKGKIRNAKVEFATNGVFREEALRLVTNMPAWTPGKVDDRVVVSEIRIPVRFELE